MQEIEFAQELAVVCSSYYPQEVRAAVGLKHRPLLPAMCGPRPPLHAPCLFTLQKQMQTRALELLKQWLGVPVVEGTPLVSGRRAQVDGAVTDKPGSPASAASITLIVEVKLGVGAGSAKGQVGGLHLVSPLPGVLPSLNHNNSQHTNNAHGPNTPPLNTGPLAPGGGGLGLSRGGRGVCSRAVP